MTITELEKFLAETFPTAKGFCKVTEIRDNELDCVLAYREDFLRPGGTISGPTMMTLADTAVYFLILAKLGPIALAVTTHLDINFLSRPAPGDLHATARLLKIGKTLVVGEVHMKSSDGTLVAQSSVTYALPRASAGA